MNELYKIFLTSGLTIFGGVLVFSIGQIVSKFLIEPIYEQSKCIGEIADALIFYADVYSDPGYQKLGESEGRREEARKSLRQYASLLISKTHMVRCYALFEKIKCMRVPTRKNIFEASENLIGLSNSSTSGDSETNQIRRKEIMTALDIKVKMD